MIGRNETTRREGADAEEAERPRVDPREIRNALLHALERALFRRQQAAEPVARVGIPP